MKSRGKLGLFATVSVCVSLLPQTDIHSRNVIGQERLVSPASGIRTTKSDASNTQTVGSTIDEIREIRNDYRKMVCRLVNRLRQIQGIGHGNKWALGHFPDDSDVRLTGAKIERRPDSDEFAIPERVSPEEEAIIYVAGEIRAVECVDLLLNRVADLGNIPNPIGGQMAVPYRQTSPAFDALCKIGEPACRETIKRITQEKDEKKRVFLTGVLQTCLGDSVARARLMEIQERIEETEQLQRVVVAISQIDSGPCPRNLHAYYKAQSRKSE